VRLTEGKLVEALKEKSALKEENLALKEMIRTLSRGKVAPIF
jgi:hypothetical protein